MTDLFTLQISDSGAWRTVLKATKEQMQDIEHHAGMIVKIMNAKRIKMRIIHAALGDVIGYCQAPDFVWTPAKIDGGAA